MSENTNAKKNVGTPAPEDKQGATTKKGEKKPMKEKKDGIFTRAKGWCKRNKNALLAGAAGVGVGVAGTIGVSEFGKRQAEKKARRNACVPQEDFNPLDPNL